MRGYDYILPRGFRFAFGNLFSIGIDNLGTTHVVWEKAAETTSLQARSGTREDDKLASCRDQRLTRSPERNHRSAISLQRILQMEVDDGYP